MNLLNCLMMTIMILLWICQHQKCNLWVLNGLCNYMSIYLADKPHIIVNGFKHAGIYSALGLLDDDDIPDYLTTDDSDTDDGEDEIEELVEPSGSTTRNHLSVAAVYSDTEEETEMNEIDQEVIIISSSEDDLEI